MHKVTSKEFQRNIGEIQERAMKETITITRYGRDHLVLLDAEKYAELRKSSRVAMLATELSDKEIQLIEQSEVPEEYNHLNKEIDNS